MTPAQLSALDGVRVLDLSGPAGNYCGKLFAGLGADVILVEPPEGTPLRRRGPYIDHIPDREHGLAMAYCNAGKRSITIDLGHPRGQALLRELVAGAHLLIETEPPGAMAARGLGAAALRAIRPSLVVASITPFGQTGPYAEWSGDDLVCLAMGGMLYLAGYPDSAPIAAAGYQAYAAASLFAAATAMAAVYAAENDGLGDALDISIQECVVMGLENAAQFYELEGRVRKRYAGDQRQAGAGVFRCADGWVYLLAGGIASNRFWNNTVDWLLQHGVSEATCLKEPQWLDLSYLATVEAKQTFAAIFAKYALGRSKLEIYASGQAARVPVCPVNTPADLLQSRQLNARQFFASVHHGFTDRQLIMPGAPYKLSATPWRTTRAAPQLGEHNAEVFAELGLGARDLELLRGEGAI